MAELTSGPTMAIVEESVSVAGGDKSNIVMKIFIAGVVLVTLCVGVKRWFYPFKVEDLESEIQVVFKVLRDNTTLEFDLLGDSAQGFRGRLAVEYRKLVEIKDRSIVEPDRRNFPGWFVFRWRELRDVKRTYLSLMVLKMEVMAEIEERRRHLQGPAFPSPSNAAAVLAVAA
ncbi:hypothetical protein PQX77_002883 [Marasmius sp. AFHP31]|nr:hypothetical protein PQX77_002883 [Marasmius sp. AFHP31]